MFVSGKLDYKDRCPVSPSIDKSLRSISLNRDRGKLLAIDMGDTGAQLIIKKPKDSSSVWTSFEVSDEPAESNTE